MLASIINSFPPFDWLWSLDPAIGAIVLLVFAVGSVALARHFGEHQPFRLKDQWYSFTLGNLGLCLSYMGLRAAADSLHEPYRIAWWTMLIGYVIFVIIRVMLTDKELRTRDKRGQPVLTIKENTTLSKRIFDLLSFPLTGLVLTATLVASVNAPSTDSAVRAWIAAATGLMIWVATVVMDGNRLTAQHPHRH